MTSFSRTSLQVEKKISFFYSTVQHKRQWIYKDESQQPTPKVEIYGRKLCCNGEIITVLVILGFKPQSDIRCRLICSTTATHV